MIDNNIYLNVNEPDKLNKLNELDESNDYDYGNIVILSDGIINEKTNLYHLTNYFDNLMKNLYGYKYRLECSYNYNNVNFWIESLILEKYDRKILINYVNNNNVITIFIECIFYMTSYGINNYVFSNNYNSNDKNIINDLKKII